MYEKRYIEEDTWEEVTEEEVVYRLSAYYTNPDDLIIAMRTQGLVARTPWAFFRWINGG